MCVWECVCCAFTQHGVSDNVIVAAIIIIIIGVEPTHRRQITKKWYRVNVSLLFGWMTYRISFFPRFYCVAILLIAAASVLCTWAECTRWQARNKSFPIALHIRSMILCLFLLLLSFFFLLFLSTYYLLAAILKYILMCKNAVTDECASEQERENEVRWKGSRNVCAHTHTYTQSQAHTHECERECDSKTMTAAKTERKIIEQKRKENKNKKKKSEVITKNKTENADVVAYCLLLCYLIRLFL